MTNRNKFHSRISIAKKLYDKLLSGDALSTKEKAMLRYVRKVIK